MSDDFLNEMVQQAVEKALERINTSTPGHIVSYDAARNRAVVRPAFPKMLADGDELEQSNIVEVPVSFTASNGGKAGLHFPLQPGDGVELVFQQRSIEDWLSGRSDAPTDPRSFDLSDCIAIPGLASTGFTGDPNNVVLKFNEATVILDPNNNISFGNSNGSIMITAAGDIILKGQTVIVDTPTRAFPLEIHRHPDIQPGLGVSGEPL